MSVPILSAGIIGEVNKLLMVTIRNILHLLRRSSSACIRNVAIIAHVDHGKTTLVDGLLRASNPLMLKHERLLDSNELERERGITIMAKSTFIEYRDHKINIVDTPGHADFGGEVERALSLVDGAILVVDATEGPMSQTKYVVSKALSQSLPFIVVVNKIDRETARIEAVETEILDMFLHLHTDPSQLNYQTLYASAKNGWCGYEIPRDKTNLGTSSNCMTPLLDSIVSQIPSPRISDSPQFSLLVNMTERIPFIGKCAFGRIESGVVNLNDFVQCLEGSTGIPRKSANVNKMFARKGLENVFFQEAKAGDLVYLAGVESVRVNDTLCCRDIKAPLPVLFHP
jgi:GTP-binding protein